MSVNLDNSTPSTPGRSKLLTAIVLICEPLWVIFCLFGLSFAAVFVAVSLLPTLADASETTTGQLIANAAIYVLATAFVLSPLLINDTARQTIRRVLGIDKRLYLSGVGWAVAAFFVYFWTTVLVGGLVSFIPGFDSEQAQEVGFDGITTSADYVMAFVGLVLLPPIFEELLFRGYLFGRLRKYVPFWLAAIVTSIAFGFVHGQWNVGVDTFVLSIFLCYLREHTGSLWASMLLHGIKNGLAYFFLFIAPLLGFNLV